MCGKFKLIIVLFSLELLIGCQQKTNQVNEARDVIRPKTIVKIGWVNDLSGSVAREGKAIQDGAQMALAEVNSSENGLNDYKLEIIMEDSAGEPRQGANAAQKLITVDEVNYLFGAAISSVTLALAPVAEANKIIHISPNSTSSKLNEAGDYVFKLREDIDGQGLAASRFLIKQKFLKAAVLYDVSNEAMLTLSKRFQEEFKRLGGEIIIVQEYNSKTDMDYKTTLNNIKSFQPDVIYLGAVGKPIENILKQIYELNTQVMIFGNSNFDDQEKIQNAGQAAEGVVFTSIPFDCEAGNNITKNFCEKYKGQYGELPYYHAGYAYDGLKVLAYILQQLDDPLDTEKVKQALYNLKGYQGVTGEISLDENGNVTDKEFGIKVVRDGKFVKYAEE